MSRNIQELVLLDNIVIGLVNKHRHSYITTEHYLYALLLSDASVENFFESINVDKSDIIQELEELFTMPVFGELPFDSTRHKVSLDIIASSVVKNVIHLTSLSKKYNSLRWLEEIVELEPTYSHASYMLAKRKITRKLINDYLKSSLYDKEELSPELLKVLNTYCVNINKRAKENKIDALVGRKDEIQELSEILLRRVKNNAIITGLPGIGKTAIVEGLADRIVKGDVPKLLKDKIIWSLDLTSLIAGTKYRGEAEERISDILKIFKQKENYILFIDEIHMMVGAGTSSDKSMDLSNMLKPALARGHLRLIGATTEEEYRKHIEKDSALVRRFKVINVEEPSIEEAKLIIKDLKKYYEEFHKVVYTDEIVDEIVELTSKYITDRYLPDKAIDVIDSCGARQQTMDDKKIINISSEMVRKQIEKISKISLDVKEEESTNIEKLEENIKSVVFGQDNAIEKVVNSVYLAKSGLNDSDKPLSTYLLAGPTGTGKTSLAVELAKNLNIPLVKFDMSEYQEPHSVSKLIGSPPGYVGYEDGAAGDGLLINKIQQHPNCLLLLDEIEKAHKNIYDVFLQVMDSGKVTSSSGKSVNCQNIILMMTTNAGATELEKNSIGFFNSKDSSSDDGVINKTFSPEFRNRIDSIIKFNKLDTKVIVQVVGKFVLELQNKLREKNIKLKIDEKSILWLAENGFDDKMGARPLKRLINEKIKQPLSKEILFGDLKNGGTTTVKIKNNTIQLIFRGKNGQ